MTKILDFECFGNIVKLYLGETVNGIYGDDWNNVLVKYGKFFTIVNDVQNNTCGYK